MRLSTEEDLLYTSKRTHINAREPETEAGSFAQERTSWSMLPGSCAYWPQNVISTELPESSLMVRFRFHSCAESQSL